MTRIDRWSTLERLRLRARDAAAFDVEQAERAKTILREQLENIRLEHRRLQQQTHRQQTGRIDVAGLMAAQRYAAVLLAQCDEMDGKIRVLDQEIDRRRHVLGQCEKELKSVRRLQEKKAAERYAAQQSAAQREMDQWSNARHARRIGRQSPHTTESP